MSSDSPLFDRIRVKPDQDRRLRAESPGCEWPQCDAPGTHRAPKGRQHANEYWRFCLDHVREYNHSYNFFAGMSDDAVARYQKDSLTGHLPTWKMGMSGNGRSRKARAGRANFETGPWAADDPFGLFGDARASGQAKRVREGRTILNAERKAVHSLGLEADASRTDIKARFKELVKRHHPDANGGDRGSEDKLREIIQAYNYLKSAGRC
jgi:curved DNA-binding protein CbpA